MKKRVKNRITFLMSEHKVLCSKIDRIEDGNSVKYELQGLLRGVTKELLFLRSLLNETN